MASRKPPIPGSGSPAAIGPGTCRASGRETDPLSREVEWLAPFCDQGDPLYEVKKLRSEATDLIETLAELLMENRLLKKSVLGDGENDKGDRSYRFVINTNTTRRGTSPISEYSHK